MASNVTRTTRRDGIQFGANGYLSLADNEIDVSSGDLTLDVANNCIINADGGGLAFKDGSNLALTIVSTATYTELLLNERGGTTVDDYFRIRCNEHSSTEIITKDTAAAAGHITLAPDGNLVLDPVSQKVIINTGDQLYFDGGTDTYIEESSADVLDINVGGERMLRLAEAGGGASDTITTGGVLVQQQDLKLTATKKLYFDGGTETYIHEVSADLLQFKVGNDTFLNMREAGSEGNTSMFKSSSAVFLAGIVTYNASDTNANFLTGNKLHLIFGSGDITDLNLTFPDGDGNFLLRIQQDGTGNRQISNWKTFDQASGNESTVAWPGGEAPTLSTGANAVDIISFYWDNTNHKAYGVASLNFSSP